MLFADSHCHILDPKLAYRAEEILRNMEADGLDFIVEISASAQESREALKFAEVHDRVFCSVGVHPSTAEGYSAEFEAWAVAQKGNKKIVGFGECGLDYHYLTKGAEEIEIGLQKEVFEKQILLADKMGLPLIVHTRDAFEDTLQILVKNKKYIRSGLLFHCFSERAEDVAAIREHFDAYFAFGGGVTYKSERADGAVRAVPLDRMVLETDAPYMTPVKAGGKKVPNEPKNVALAAGYIAELLGGETAQIAKSTLDNTKMLFHLPNQ